MLPILNSSIDEADMISTFITEPLDFDSDMVGCSLYM